jgi:hypothetical protein
MTGIVRCARCGRSWTAEGWQQLPLERMLSSQDVAEHVSTWPADAVVQIRSCTGCGGAIARTAGRCS